jgi:hypothetical protein
MRPQYLGVVVLLGLAARALGDGCYVPERAVLKIPEIPAQRAVLVWKDGAETLVIASALDSEAQRLGWLIPLPAVPQTIEKGTPGALKTLAFCIQPEITHDLREQLQWTAVFVVLGNLLLATYLFKRKRFLDLVVLLLLVFLLYSLLLSASAGRGSGATQAANVQVEKTATVGSYQISVLRPAQADALNAWLAENGFSSLPPAADATVSDYIARGWVFAAVKLTRSESGANAPHPLKMAFLAKEPIYPLRLTAIAGGTTDFEIFVVAPDRASCNSLTEVYCDRFSAADDEDGDPEAQRTLAGAATHRSIGHPDICALMWDGCVLAKFAGSLSASDMTDDIRFGWREFEPRQQHFYTAAGARAFAIKVFLCLAGGWLAGSMFLCRGTIAQPGGRKRYFGVVLLPAVGLLAAGAAVLFLLLPKLNDADVQISRGARSYYGFPQYLQSKVEYYLKEHPLVLWEPEDQIATHILDGLADTAANKTEMTNPFTGLPVTLEDSPGNLTVEKRDGKVMIRVFDRVGRALTIERPMPGGVPPGQ